MKPKKLIEVALPIKEISAESVRDKSIRHGHISTLHLWWARRPLPVCRAIVFASLVPDPLDENCPQAFRDAIEALLNSKTGSALTYKPYDDIPYTSIKDPMEDNERNRLMMFIGKFSDKCQANMLAGKSTSPKEQLSDGSLIKWENKNNPKILHIARELIWVAYHSENDPSQSFASLESSFNAAFDAIKKAEDELYSIVDRNEEAPEVKEKETALQQAIDNFLQQMPSVFDPFAGGGAIPLEAARLGCRSYGNDINPVAHIIERGSAEYPQKYGKSIIYSKSEFDKLYGEDGRKMLTEKGIPVSGNNTITISNRLSWDVEYYAREILKETESQVGEMYPKDDKGRKPVAYLWARTAKCTNPSCNAEVPLLKSFYVCNKPNKKYYLSPEINGNKIVFSIQKGSTTANGFLKARECSLTCPCCGNVTSSSLLKEQFLNKETKEIPLVAIFEGHNGKEYRTLTDEEKEILNKKYDTVCDISSKMQVGNNRNFNTPGWGFDDYAQLYTNRQLHFLYYFLDNFKKVTNSIPQDDYAIALKVYLAIWFDRVAIANTSFGVYHTSGEKLERIMGRQAIPMTFDFPESNPFCTESGSAINQVEWITRYLESEGCGEFSAKFANASSGDKLQFKEKSLTAVVTDPPYYDAIAYADLSDFFYMWMKKTIGNEFPLSFATPQTPKAEECTALKHHHHNKMDEAKKFFEKKLTDIFSAIELQTQDVVSIMYAHQSTEAWTTLCNSIIGARMNIYGSWPMDTEMQGALKTNMAYLESSVTVACRPSERHGFGEYKTVKRNIENKVTEEVNYLYELGFRGADLLTACFGQAASEFGQYKSVEKADGSEVSVAELLELAKDSAYKAFVKGVPDEEFTRFYIGWLYLYGTGEFDHDDATKFTRVGVNINISDIIQEKILISNGNKVHLATAEEHIRMSGEEGSHPNDSPISQAHRAILLYKGQNRRQLLKFVAEICPEASSPLWRLLATMKELLPQTSEDGKQVQGLLQNADDLRKHCHEFKPIHKDLFENK